MHARRILVPIDFSEDSRFALAEADRTALASEGSLTLLHVHRVVQAVFMDATYFERPERLVPAVAALEDRLAGMAADLRTPSDRVTCRVTLGTPAEEIVAATIGHDLVVMGSHGRSGVSRWLMGSVAERVVRGAACSVLVVKRAPPERAEK